ncbi:MAG: acetyl-coenzyme A synthetase N-terminal domain-containing protein [Nocardioidaceae bacterium]
MGAWRETHDRSLSDPEGFWGEQAELVSWFAKPTVILDRSRPPFYRWYAGGRLNTCYNALDRHVIAGRADQLALIYDSAMTGAQTTFTYAKLLEKVAAFAGALRAFGVGRGIAW